MSGADVVLIMVLAVAVGLAVRMLAASRANGKCASCPYAASCGKERKRHRDCEVDHG